MQYADWKHLVANGLHQSGSLRALRAFSRCFELFETPKRSKQIRKARVSKYVILNYHGVGISRVPIYSRLPQQVFAQQMRYIRRHYRVLSLRELAWELQQPNCNAQGIIVTFDDGYLSTYTEAFPVLKEYGIPATVYLIAGAIESGTIAWYDRIFLAFQRVNSGSFMLNLNRLQQFHLGTPIARVEAATEVITYLRKVDDLDRVRWCAGFERTIPLPEEDLRGWMMTWEQVRAMKRAGISFGAHTMTHPVVSRLSRDSLSAEIVGSKQLIENRLDCEVEDFAFPFGKPEDCGHRAKPVLSDAGYLTAVTTLMGVNTSGADRFDLRRVTIGNDTSLAMFAFRLSRLFLEPLVHAAVGTGTSD